jgi:hypothetical protein
LGNVWKLGQGKQENKLRFLKIMLVKLLKYLSVCHFFLDQLKFFRCNFTQQSCKYLVIVIFTGTAAILESNHALA